MIQCPECGAKLSAILEAKPDATGSANSNVAHVFASSTKTSTSTRTRHSYEDPWFQGFWEEYPRKIAKKPASKAFNSAIKRGANPQAIADAARVFSALHRRNATEARFIPYPASWLNDERYDDDIEEMAVVQTDPAYVKGTPEWDARVQAEEERAIEEMSYEL